jgi:hypothetical protein
MERGRPRSFATPQDLWDEFVEYCDKTKEQPILVKDWIGPKAVQVYREKEAPLTMEGFRLHLWDKGIADGGKEYFLNRTGTYQEFTTVCSRIKEAIRADQIKGGMAGIYNPSITQRLNGLVEKQETSITIEQPLFGDGL